MAIKHRPGFAAIYDHVYDYGSQDAARPLQALSPLARCVRTCGTQIRRRDLYRRPREGHRQANGPRGRRLICRGAGRGVSQSSIHVMSRSEVTCVRESFRLCSFGFVEIHLAFEFVACVIYTVWWWLFSLDGYFVTPALPVC